MKKHDTRNSVLIVYQSSINVDCKASTVLFQVPDLKPQKECGNCRQWQRHENVHNIQNKVLTKFACAVFAESKYISFSIYPLISNRNIIHKGQILACQNRWYVTCSISLWRPY
jgi:hypothetical protein